MRTVFSIIIVGAVLWFAVANAGAITLHLLLWDVNASLALVIGIAFLLGFLLGVLRLAPGYLRRHAAARTSERSLAEVKGERDTLAERSRVLEEQVHQLAPQEEQNTTRIA